MAVEKSGKKLKAGFNYSLPPFGYSRKTQSTISVSSQRFGRQTTNALVEANTRYRNGDKSALPDIAARFRTIAKFYPRHIEKEDPASLA